METTITASGARSILRWSLESPRSIAIVEDGSSRTYDEVALDLAKTTKFIAAAGVAAGMIVGIQCSRRYPMLQLMLACEVIGATHCSLRVDELKASDPTAKRCHMFLAEHAANSLSSIGKVVAIAADLPSTIGSIAVTQEDLDRLSAHHGPEAKVRIGKTSGTTGSPKFMASSRSRIDRIVAGYDRLRPVDGPYRCLCLYPLSVGGVYIDVMRALQKGNEIHFLDATEQFIAAARPNAYAMILPRETDRLVELCRSRELTLNLYYVDVTGAGVQNNFQASIAKYLSAHAFNVYSSAEASLIALREAEGRYSILPDVEVEIVDPLGQPQRPGDAGTIRVRSPYLVDSYLWNEELTALHFKDGWFLMSDVGYISEEGHLVVVGRSDELLNIGGEKISPIVIEDALKSIAGVNDVTVLQFQNENGVGVLCVAIERTADTTTPEIFKQASKRMGPGWQIYVTSAFPRTETGKVQRNALKSIVERARRAPSADSGPQ